jgi:Transcription elongation factor
MSKIILSSIEQPLAQSAPRTNIYEGREVDPGRIRAQVQAGPEIRNGAAAGLASLAQGLSAWTGVARAWSSRKERPESESPQDQPDDGGFKGRAGPGPEKGSRPKGQIRQLESEAAGEPDFVPADQARTDRDLDLDRAALLEAVRAHDGEMAAFAENQAQLNGRAAIDDPLTGQQGLTGQALNWMKEYDQKFEPKFRRPETGEMYRQALEQRRSQLVEGSEARQVGEEEAWREEVFESDLDLMVQTMFQDPTPQRLADLDAEIETLWPAPEAEERRADIRDRSYGQIARTILDGGNLGEAEAFVNQYKDNFKSETIAKLHQAFDYKESELILCHTALAEVLPDLATDEARAILTDGQASQPLEELYRTAEDFWDLPAEKAAEFRRGRQAARAANEWLGRPDRSFKAFPELLAEAERELKGADESGQASYALVERELKKREREFNDDPIGHVISQRDAALERLLAQGGLDEGRGPELAQMKIALGRSLAKKMGMEDRGLVLSWEEARQYRDQLAQAPGPAERLDLLTECDKLFGRYSERAFRQLDVPAEERLTVWLNRHHNPAVRELALLGLDRTAAPAEPWLQSLAHNEADDSPYGRELMNRLTKSDWEDDQAWEGLSALRNLAATVVAAGAAQGHPRPGRLAARLLGGLSEMAGTLIEREGEVS